MVNEFLISNKKFFLIPNDIIKYERFFYKNQPLTNGYKNSYFLYFKFVSENVTEYFQDHHKIEILRLHCFFSFFNFFFFLLSPIPSRSSSFILGSTLSCSSFFSFSFSSGITLAKKARVVPTKLKCTQQAWLTHGRQSAASLDRRTFA